MAARRDQVMATALRAARTAKQAQVQSAGRKPAFTPAGLPRWPWAEKTALASASANTVPKRCAM
jgi:hypothetical protein